MIINIYKIADEFSKKILSKYKKDNRGTYNCAWATQQFVLWAEKNKLNAKAIYFVWDKNGESHIAPVLENKIIDFTFKQFDKNFNYCAKITNINEWETVYRNYGFGVNFVLIEGKKKSAIIDSLYNLALLKDRGIICKNS